MTRFEVPALLTTAEVAALWNVNVKTATRGADDGRLATIRTPAGTRRFTVESVRAALVGGGLPVAEADRMIAAVVRRGQAGGS